VPACVLEDDWIVRADAIERSVQRNAFHVGLRGAVPLFLMPAPALDQGTARSRLDRARHLGHDVVPVLRVGEIELGLCLTEGQVVTVALDEARHHHASPGIDALGLGVRQPLDLGVRTDSENPVSAHRDGLGARMQGIDGVHRSVGDDQVGAILGFGG